MKPWSRQNWYLRNMTWLFFIVTVRYNQEKYESKCFRTPFQLGTSWIITPQLPTVIIHPTFPSRWTAASQWHIQDVLSSCRKDPTTAAIFPGKTKKKERNTRQGIFCTCCLQVLQRRTIGKQDFLKRWRQYIAGFGDMREEFWIGECSSVLSAYIKHAHRKSNGVFLIAFTFSVLLFPQVWIRYTNSPTLLLSMSWGLTWAWAQREFMPCMTTLRSHRSSRSSNSLLANTEGQQVGLVLLKSFLKCQEYKSMTLKRQHDLTFSFCSIQGVTKERRGQGWQRDRQGWESRGFKRLATHPSFCGVLRKQIHTNSRRDVCFRNLYSVSYRQ